MPFWLLTTCVVAPALVSSPAAKRSRTSASAAGLQLAQPAGLSNARRAASTARSTSASVEGETTVIVDVPATHSPPI
jgi:hypothetical protein